MKIGAGGLQSQIIEDAIKIRQVDPARNKPGQDDHTSFEPLDGRKKARQELHPPLNEPAKGVAVDNFNEYQWSLIETKASPVTSNLLVNQQVGTYVDVYI